MAANDVPTSSDAPSGLMTIGNAWGKDPRGNDVRGEARFALTNSR